MLDIRPLQLRKRFIIYNVLLVLCIYPSSGCPKKCQCLRGGIVVCQNKYLLEIPRDLPNDTVHAYIGANFIRRIRKDTFRNTNLLQTLELSSNFLREIEPGAFSHMKGLTTLTLRDNRLPSISKETFTGLRNLQNLDLSGVSPEGVALCIDDGSFADLENLVSLKLDHNNMIGLSNKTLFGLHMLEQLDLSHNNLQLIAPYAFETLKSAAVMFDETIRCCCSTVRAMKSIASNTNGRCLKSCSNDFRTCQKEVKSSCVLGNNPLHNTNRLDDLASAERTNDKVNYKEIPQNSLPSKDLITNVSFDLRVQRQFAYTSNQRHNGVNLSRSEQWSIAITTCLVFVVSVVLFLMVIYCKKKKFTYHINCCSQSECVLKSSTNDVVHEVNLMNKYFTAPNESNI